MPNIAVTSFNNGEVTPHIDARSDVEKYHSSCRKLENMLPLIYGDATRRPGTKYIATAKNSPQGIRLIPFIYSSEIAYMCEFGNLYIRFYHDGAPLLDGSGDPVETVSPYLVGDLPQLQFRQIADTMWLVHPDYAPQKLTRTTITSFSLDEITFEKGPFLPRNDLENDDSVTMTSSVTVVGTSGTLTASAATFENEHVGALWQLEHTNKAVVRIDGVVSPTVANITVLTTVDLTTATLKWYEGAWSRVRGHPGAITFFESRIIYGGSDYEPQTIWFSATDDYEDFEAGTSDADSFSIMLAATNRILWLEALEALAVGTSGDEWRISSTKLDAPLTPTNFGAKVQSTYGSAPLQAVRVNTAVLFVDYVRRKVREFTFSADQQKYVAPDLAVLAEHITESGIVSTAHQKSPDSIFWSVRADGTLLSMTYERDQNVVAWARHLVGLTEIESTDTDLTVISAVDGWSNVVTGSGGSLGALLYDQAYLQVVRTRNAPHSFTYHVHQDINGYIYTGQLNSAGAGVACSPVKMTPQLEVVAGWPSYTTWPVLTNYVYSVRPSHDGEYVYVLNKSGSYIMITKLTADTGALVWRVTGANITAIPWDIGVLSNGDVVIPNWTQTPAGVYYPAIMSAEDGSRTSHYWDGSTDNRGIPANYRICVVESINKWFTCGVNQSGATSRGVVQAFNLGNTSQLTRAWEFDPVPGSGTNTVRGVVYKDGYIYAAGDRVVYGAGYACVWKINAETGAYMASADLGFAMQDIFLKNDLTLVAVRSASSTDTWTELTDDLEIISQTDKDDTPVTNQTIWRAEAVPEPLLYPGAPTVNTITTEATGEVESVAVIPGDAEDEVWISVLRTVNGSTARYIERMQPRAYDSREDAFFVDCGIIYDGDPAGTFTGLDHLEGETVAILGDGAVYPAQVVSGGSVTISEEVSKAVIGLPFRFNLKPMRLDQLYANAPAGSSHGSYKKIAELVVSFLKTLNAQYGISEDELFDLDWRTTEAHDGPPDLYTGDQVAVLDGGFDPEDPILISGADPLPCTVRAIIARLDVIGR